MAIIKWTGAAGDFDSSNPANWQGGSVPTAADDAVLDATAGTSMRLLSGTTQNWKSFSMTGGGILFEGATVNTVGAFAMTGGSMIDAGSFGSGTHVNVGGNFTLSIDFFADVNVNFAVTGTAIAHNAAIAHCDFSGGTALDASDGCTDHGNNTNVNFGAPLAAKQVGMWGV